MTGQAPFAEWLVVARFGAVGLLNTAFGYAVFATMTLLHSGVPAALLVSIGAGVLFNYQTSRRLVFRSAGRKVRFFAVFAVVLLVNWAALRVLLSLDFSSLLAQAMLVIPVAALSFAGQWLLVFGPPANRSGVSS